ncbi:M23 family metallopeptidase [Caulobacter vibrioides]|uniref:M23 family peptidoglycan-specific endopeptidase LdpE n=1 Tax=Caulobacter vibrioides (strain NA1000 / CB15N) TaxID=565050 RepID=A0A0H3CD72_CAUVN|nr:M23 family metallopeptidase [Caulobacter vibrioides]YP_002518783.1 M23 family peptidoglycan-specific endopeptidase LdpE [Caulobacter vibrioides NA1000]ACL96875.1 M23 family peptidoglycan-specific endopeptidase LdpE [Caulobacter vibrioides NA1000]ATC30127.1 M23 family peptidase [Caulobacter vibrioides]QXZ51652.1 M23 family metallopeptidase [Caulobacter vibrioides]
MSLALSPQHLRVALFSMLGIAAMVIALNGAVAMSEWIARAPTSSAIPAVAQPAPEPEVQAPPPAFVFDAPLPGRVINSPFGLRQMPWEESGRLHQGVDIAAPAGAAVKVAAPGVVKATGVSATYGRYVLVVHKGGLSTLYAHLARPARSVKRGAYLRRGDIVAFVGNSGRSSGSHLHFEIRKGDKPLNPSFFLGRTFAEADDLPLRAAGRVSRKVHKATVSRWPPGVTKPAKEKVQLARLKTGRAKAAIPVSTVPAPAASTALSSAEAAI